MKLDHQVYVGFSVLFLFFVILFFNTSRLSNRISEINKKIDEGDYDIRNHIEKNLIGNLNNLDNKFKELSETFKTGTNLLTLNKTVESFANPRQVIFNNLDEGKNLSNENSDINIEGELEDLINNGSIQVNEMSNDEVNTLLTAIDTYKDNNPNTIYDFRIIDIKGSEYKNIDIHDFPQRPFGGILIIYNNDTIIRKFNLDIKKYNIIDNGIQEIAFIKVTN